MKKQTKYILIISVAALLVIGGIVGVLFGLPAYQTYKSYQSAEQLLQDGQYEEAKNAFWALGEYKDSADKMKECDYQKAKQLLKAKKYNEAKELFEQLGEYSDSKSQVKACEYGRATDYLTAKDYDAAKSIFESLGKYKDSAEKITACQYGIAENYLSQGEYQDAKKIFQSIKDYSDATDRIKECDYQQAGSYLKDGDYENAEKIYKTLKNYKETKKKIKECKKLREEAEIQKVLDAYQDYWDELKYENNYYDDEYESEWYCTLAYVDNDNIPECIMNYDTYNTGQRLLTYKDGKVCELAEKEWGTGYIGYIKKKNIVSISGINGSFIHGNYFKLTDSGYKKIGSSIATFSIDDSGDYFYFIDLGEDTELTKENSVSKEKYEAYNASFSKNGEYERYELIYDTVQEAYEAIK